MIKEPESCRIFKAHDSSIAQGKWVSFDLAWITHPGVHEIIVVVSDDQAHLSNRQGDRMPLSLQAAKELQHGAHHRIRYRECIAQGEGWKGRYRCYEGRLDGSHRFLLDEGDQLPRGLGRDVTRCDLEISMPPLRTHSITPHSNTKREP